MQPLKAFCNLFFKLTLPVGTSRKLLRNGVSLSIGSIFSLVLKREMWSFYIQDGTFKFQHFWNLSTLEYQISVGHWQLFQYPVISGVNAESSLSNLTIYFSKPQSCLSFWMYSIQIHSFKARRLRLCMRPLLIVSQVMGGMRPASAAFEAIEAEVLLKVWDVLHLRVVGEGG